MSEVNAKAISEYLFQYFTGGSYAEGVLAAWISMANGESGFRALKHGIAKAREFELRAV